MCFFFKKIEKGWQSEKNKVCLLIQKNKYNDQN